MASSPALDRTGCLRLLESTAVGRVAWAGEGGRVVVIPVNFVLDGDTIVFRSAPGGSGHRLPPHTGEISVERQGPWRSPTPD